MNWSARPRKAWAAVTSGTVDPEAAQLPARGEAEAAGLAAQFATLHQAEQALRGYLAALGVGEVAPSGPPPAAQPSTSPPPTPPAAGERVEQARQRVGRATTAGGEARGEWVRSDGWSVRVTSGAGDEHHDAVVRFARDSRLPPAVTRLARHVEVKVAVAMRERGLRDETVVIDRQVCGTRPFDQPQPFTCDKYLALPVTGRTVARGAGGPHGSHLHREGRGIRMTLVAAVPTFRDGVPGGEAVTVTTDEDVTRLVELLARPWADTGSIQTADAVLDVHVHDRWGYLLYSGEAGYLVTDGDPDSPAGSGLPVERITDALREFVRTQRLPGAVPWRDAG